MTSLASSLQKILKSLLSFPQMPEVLPLQSSLHVLLSASEVPYPPLPSLTHMCSFLSFWQPSFYSVGHFSIQFFPYHPHPSTHPHRQVLNRSPGLGPANTGTLQDHTLRILITSKHKACKEARLVKGAKCRSLRAWDMEPVTRV